MKDIWEETGASLRLAAEQMKHFYNRHCKDTYPYKPGDKVWLEGYTLQTDRPSKKLSDKCYGPFTILSKISTAAYKLKLPRTWKSVWPVFNKLLLTPYKEPAYDSQQHPPPPPPKIIEDQEEYEVNKIHDSKLVCEKLKYLVEWFGYPEQHEWTWEPAAHIKNAPQESPQRTAPCPTQRIHIHSYLKLYRTARAQHSFLDRWKRTHRSMATHSHNHRRNSYRRTNR